MADVVYFITDMLFSSKLREAAKATGVTVQPARDPAAFAAAAREAKLAIVTCGCLRRWRRWRRWEARSAPSGSSTTKRPR